MPVRTEGMSVMLLGRVHFLGVCVCTLSPHWEQDTGPWKENALGALSLTALFLAPFLPFIPLYFAQKKKHSALDSKKKTCYIIVCIFVWWVEGLGSYPASHIHS